MKDDIETLKLGVVNLVDRTNHAGQGLVYVDSSRQGHDAYSRESMIRALWYVLHVATENESIQKNGLYLMVDGHRARSSSFDPGLSKQTMPLVLGALPIRIAGVAIVRPTPFVGVVLPVVKLFLSERLRKLIFVVKGSDEAVVEQLEDTFGMTTAELPSELNGEVLLDREGWVENRRQLESR